MIQINTITLSFITLFLNTVDLCASNQQLVAQFHKYCIERSNIENNTSFSTGSDKVHNDAAKKQLKQLAQSISLVSMPLLTQGSDYQHAKIFLQNLSPEHNFEEETIKLSDEFKRRNNARFYS